MRYLCFAAFLLAAACATPYGKMGFMGGVSAEQIDGRTIRIIVRVNSFTSGARINDFVCLKSAEETLRLGYAGFANWRAPNGEQGIFIRLLTAKELAVTPGAFNARLIYRNLAPRYMKQK